MRQLHTRSSGIFSFVYSECLVASVIFPICFWNLTRWQQRCCYSYCVKWQSVVLLWTVAVKEATGPDETQKMLDDIGSMFDDLVTEFDEILSWKWESSWCIFIFLQFLTPLHQRFTCASTALCFSNLIWVIRPCASNRSSICRFSKKRRSVI